MTHHKHWFTTALLALTLGLCACSSLSNSVFRTELAAASSADAALRGYAVYWKTATNNPPAYNRTLDGLLAERALIEGLSKKVGASIEISESLRQSYATNSAVKPALEASLLTLSGNVSNIIAVVGQFISVKPTP